LCPEIRAYIKEMPHVYHIFLGMVDEEDKAYTAMAKFLQKTLV
jgi:hypothetical protein